MRAYRWEGRTLTPKLVKEADWAERYLRELRHIAGPMADLSVTEKALQDGMDGDYFSQRLSKLRKLLRQHLGNAAAKPYLIDDGGSRPHRYRLELPAHAVTIGVVAKQRQPSRP